MNYRASQLWLVTLLLFIGFSANAQQKELTYTDCVWANPALFPDHMQGLKWIADSDNFSYNANNCVVKANATNTKRDTIIRLSDINTAFTRVSEKPSRRLPAFRWFDSETIRLSKSGNYYIYNLADKTVKKINSVPEKAENIDISPERYIIAYTLGNNLFATIDGKQIAITGDKNEKMQNGANDVHRNEFGISKGTFWSPKATKIAFYRMDETPVSDYPLVATNQRIAKHTPTPYPMAGMPSHHVTVGVYNFDTKKLVFLKTGEPKEQYLTNISWSPDEKTVFVAVLNRDQNHLWFNQYDATTGEKIATLFEETNERYVEPQQPAVFFPNSTTDFVWQSRRDGYNHLYHYNTKGEMVNQLTKGDWLVKELIGFSAKGDNLYYTSTAPSPLGNYAYVLNLKKEKHTLLTPEHGTHNVSIAKSGNYLIDTYSSTDVVRKYTINNTKGKVVQPLLESKNPLNEYAIGEMEIGKIAGEFGDSLYYRLIKPSNFDPNKRYPAIVYVYGGPHAQLITDTWLGGAGFWLNLLAEQGYVVFTVDNHGSASRGYEFESCIHRQCGTIEVKDQMKGVEFLTALPYVDAERIGVDGWSYGGFMTINLLLSHPGTFKAGCAGGPVCDWKYYEIMYGERYMDTPADNEEGYKAASLIERADQLNDELLIIHSTTDPVVVWQHSLDFVQKCIEHGIQLDYFVYPGHDHNVGGMDRAHLLEKITTYFNDTL